MENIKETREKLQRLSNQINERNILLSDVQMSEEKYIENNSNIEKPSKRSVTVYIDQEAEFAKYEGQISNIKTNTKIQKVLTWPILICCGLSAIVNIFTGNIIGLFVILPFALVGFWFKTGAKKGEEKLVEVNSIITNGRKRAKKEDEENRIFNETEYPELLKAYNIEVERLKPLYVEMHNAAQAKLDALEEEMERDGHILAQKYHDDIEDIIEIIDNGRANSLSEAINILISDQNAERLLREQRRQNEIQAQAAEMQRREMERHNRAMEENAREQLEMQRDKIDYAKCHNCEKESYCYKKTCYGYRPKRNR